MQVQPEICYHQVTKSEAVDALIRDKIDHLEQFCDHITSCAVAVERPHSHESTGNAFRVRVDVHVPPGHEIVGIAGQEQNDMHDPLQTVVIDAFEKVERQLKKLTDRQHGETKTHQEPIGSITQLNLEERYGYVTDGDGRDIYFDQSSLVGSEFDQLSLGMSVVYTEELGPQGARASTLRMAL
jgi:ribosomal subunit interface protein